MASEHVDININDVIREQRKAFVTLRLTGTKTFRFRLWIATKLIQFAAIVAGPVMKVEIER